MKSLIKKLKQVLLFISLCVTACAIAAGTIVMDYEFKKRIDDYEMKNNERSENTLPNFNPVL